jgi:hypothetical protein
MFYARTRTLHFQIGDRALNCTLYSVQLPRNPSADFIELLTCIKRPLYLYRYRVEMLCNYQIVGRTKGEENHIKDRLHGAIWFFAPFDRDHYGEFRIRIFFCGGGGLGRKFAKIGKLLFR